MKIISHSGLSFHYSSMAFLSQGKERSLDRGLVFWAYLPTSMPIPATFLSIFLSYLVNCINKKTAPVTPRETKNPLQKSVIKLLILFYLFSKIFDEKYGDKWPRFKKISSTPPILLLPSIDHQ